jgi:hypothetical protein
LVLKTSRDRDFNQLAKHVYEQRELVAIAEIFGAPPEKV